MIDGGRRSGKRGRRSGERDGRDGGEHAAGHIQAEAVQRQIETVRVASPFGDEVIDLIFAPDVRRPDKTERAERPL